MTFWLLVGCGYLLLLAVGLAAGHLLGSWWRRRGNGGSDQPASPAPTGPSFALEQVPPLGSAFDRALLPGVFDGEPLTESV